MSIALEVTVSEFRERFPEFASAILYPDAQVELWLSFAHTCLNKRRWRNLYHMGLQLFTAHNLALEKMAQDSAKTGATPGVSTGPISGKSVGKVRVDYASKDALYPNAGHWNLTTYGTRFWDLLNIAGMGPLQVNIGITPPFTLGAWSGPYPGIGPTGFS